jgi:two-component system KDP operon response regulator KdpE
MRRVLRATLIARNYRVVEAASGEDALKKFSVEPCDCVLLDLNLPGIDGIATCRAIRRNSKVPIIVVSIRDSEKDHLAAQEAGVDDYIAKPFGIDELLSRIQTVSRQKPDSCS